MPKTSFTVAEAWPAVAIGAGLYVAVKLVKGIMPDDQVDDPTRAQTNGGAPVDVPGQKLVGEPDYIKVYKGQKVSGLQRFGELAAEPASANNHAYPVTTRAYATEILGYWAREISRLVGFDSSSTLNGIFGEDKPLDFNDLSERFPASIYNGMVSKDSARAILHSWHSAQLDALVELHGSDPMSAEGTVRFWDAINRIAIAVDVDRAVPDFSGYTWIAIYESALEAPGLIGDAVTKVAKETSGVLWRVFGAAAVNLLFSPLGLALAGASIYLYRGELAALTRRL